MAAETDLFEQMKADSDREWAATLRFFELAHRRPEGGQWDAVTKMVLRSNMGCGEEGIVGELGAADWYRHLAKLCKNARARGHVLFERTVEANYAE